MFEQLLMMILKLKFHAVAAWKIPVIATLLVLGTTGFVVSGTVQADEDGEKRFNFTVKPLETKKCVDALIAQTDTLLQLDVLAGDAQVQLRRMRERARDSAEEQRKLLDQVALLTQSNTSSEAIRAALSEARAKVMAAADLSKCQDGDENTTVDVDVDVLRQKYDEILREFGRRLTTILIDAQKAFDDLVRNAPAKPPVQPSGGSHSDD